MYILMDGSHFYIVTYRIYKLLKMVHFWAHTVFICNYFSPV